MFEQSLTYAILLRIKSFFGLFKTSATYGLVLALVSCVKNLVLAFKTSRTKKIIYGFASFIREAFQTSSTRKYMLGTSRFEKARQTSFFYNLSHYCISKILIFSGKSVSFVKRCFAKSFTGALLAKLGSLRCMRFEYVLGAFFAVVMIFPGPVWNNIYAVGGAFIFAFAYYISSASGRNFATDVRSVPLSLFAFYVAILGGAVMSPSLSDGIRIALFFISSIIFSLLVWGSVSDVERLKKFIVLIISALVIMCLYAIYQAIVGVEVDYLLTDIETNKGMPGRAYSTFDNPNNFAEAIVLVVPFLYALIICAKDKKQKAIFFVLFAICLAALGTTYSRSCFIAFAIATVTFALMYDWRLLIPLALIAIVAIPFLPESIINRILTIGSMKDTSNSYRLYLWDATLALAREKGLAGVGIGPEAFMTAYREYAHPLAAKAPHSHMLYLELLVELGVVGVVSFLVFIMGVIKKGFKTIGSTNKELKCIIIAGISALLGISFTACAEYIWFYPRVMFVFWLVVGILLAAIRCSKNQSK